MAANAELLNQVLSLPEEDRAEIAHRLLLSFEREAFDPGCRQAWKEELASRLAGYKAGEIKARDWREVMADVRRELEGKVGA